MSESANTPRIAPHTVRVFLLAFVVLFAYGLARPAIESLFLEEHGSSSLPMAWIMVAAVTILVVAAYQRVAMRRDLSSLFTAAAIVSVASLVAILGLRRMGIAGTGIALYVWKDVHVVVLLELVWSSANVIFRTNTARWTYGLFCVAGTLGDLSGNLVTTHVAASFSTESALWLPLGPLVAAAVINELTSRGAHAMLSPPVNASVSIRDAVSAFRASDYLPLLLAMILVVQIVITLVDYIYNASVETAFPVEDARTVVIAQVYAAVAVVALVLQLGAGAVLRFVGVHRVLVGVPATLAAILAAFMLAPAVGVMLVLKVASKAFDYSIFRVAKEMLYIPLSYDEKTRGKSLIDMLTYRVAKGGASLVLAALVGVELGSAVAGVTLALLAAWVFFAWRAGQRYRARLRTAPGGS